MDTPPGRLPLYLGLVLIACGWAVLYLGWQQAGEQELQTGQLPFVLSGGFGAVGLWLLGMTGILVDAVQRSRWERQRDLRDLRAVVAELRVAVEQIGATEEDSAPPAANTKKGGRRQSGRSRSRTARE